MAQEVPHDLTLSALRVVPASTNASVPALQVEGESRLGVWTKAEKITDDADAARTLTVAESGTVFIVDDAALAITLPALSSETVGVRYRFIISDKESTGLVVKANASDNTEYFSGYSVGVVSAGVAESFVPNGTSNSKVTLNGTTTGGNVTGEAGNTLPLNKITVTGIASSGKGWFVECELVSGVGETMATPFADQ